MAKIENVVLRNGVQIPYIGLGTYKASISEDMQVVVNNALEVGYRSIDTAEHYGNEDQVGAAIRNSGYSREELFLTTKIWNTDHGYEKTMCAFEKSVRKLGTYVDMLLIHWPCPMNGLYQETWRALQDLYAAGKVKAIGVSNFKIHHLEELRKLGGEQPMVNQIEMHPSFIQDDMLKYCRENKIQVEAWSPLLRGAGTTGNPIISALGEKYGRSPVQITLRYLVQLGARVMVKSSSKEHTAQNAQIFDFTLSDEDMALMHTLNTGKRAYQDPDEYYL